MELSCIVNTTGISNARCCKLPGTNQNDRHRGDCSTQVTIMRYENFLLAAYSCLSGVRNQIRFSTPERRPESGEFFCLVSKLTFSDTDHDNEQTEATNRCRTIHCNLRTHATKRNRSEFTVEKGGFSPQPR